MSLAVSGCPLWLWTVATISLICLPPRCPRWWSASSSSLVVLGMAASLVDRFPFPYHLIVPGRVKAADGRMGPARLVAQCFDFASLAVR
ncbi:hypothetical protein D3C87_1830740 [compost metagenome]